MVERGVQSSLPSLTYEALKALGEDIEAFRQRHHLTGRRRRRRDLERGKGGGEDEVSERGRGRSKRGQEEEEERGKEEREEGKRRKFRKYSR